MSERLGRSVPGWEGAAPVTPSTSKGRWVEIVPLASGHVPGLWEAFSGAGDRLWDYMSYGPFASREDLSRLIEEWEGSIDPVFFAFVVQKRPVGWGSYLRAVPAMGTVEVGHLAFAPRLQRTTAATEAMYLMARRAFDDLGYRRYEWKCDDLNEASRRAAERFGFTYEGTFRSHMVYKGRNRDTAWYAITDDEWPQLRHAYEQWLEPSNFDETSRQLRSLGEVRSQGHS
ncbi:GNAT family protein [soil metagenome]